MHHYRDPWSTSWFELFKAKRLDRDIKLALAAESYPGNAADPYPFQEKFKTALENDLNTKRSLKVIQDLVSNILTDSRVRNDVSRAQDQLREFGDVLGLQMDQVDPSEDVRNGWNDYHKKFSESNLKERFPKESSVP
jgi:cysteinyl-tRNA synthetase